MTHGALSDMPQRDMRGFHAEQWRAHSRISRTLDTASRELTLICERCSNAAATDPYHSSHALLPPRCSEPERQSGGYDVGETARGWRTPFLYATTVVSSVPGVLVRVSRVRGANSCATELC